MAYGSVKVWTEEWDGVPVIGAEGEIDLGTVDSFRQAVSEAVGLHPSSLIFDLRQVKYMDSSGLGILVAARRKLGGTDPVVVISDQPAVIQALRITGLDRVLKVLSEPSSYCRPLHA